MNIPELIDNAMEARERSYAPYSHFTVGVALITEEEEIFTGCNIENASFGATICGERVAFYSALAAGYNKFTAIALVGAEESKIVGDKFIFPCGLCRQVMAEFCGPDFEIIVAKSRDNYSLYTLSELLPHSFQATDIK